MRFSKRAPKAREHFTSHRHIFSRRLVATMFSRWGERSGLFGILAPRAKAKPAPASDEQEAPLEESTGTLGSELKSSQGEDSIADSTRTTEDNNDEILSSTREKVPQEKQKSADELILEGQKSREVQALARDDFCKNQRARYLHKASQTWFDNAHIVGVHHDDGVDQPYYTIMYHPRPEEEPVEKQTTRDRLAHVPWDEQKTLEILSSRRAKR